MFHPATRCLLLATATALSALSQNATPIPSTIVGAGYLFPAPINVAPGQVITIFATGVGATLTAPVFAGPGTLPTSLAGISVTIQQGKNIPAPILEVSPVSSCGSGCAAITAITLQIPYSLVTLCSPSLTVCSNSNVLVQTNLFVTENGVAGNVTALNPLPDHVHILTTCDTVLPGASGIAPLGGLPCQPEVTHADGTLVSTASPANTGEELVAYAVGLGATTPAASAGQPATQPIPTVETFMLDFNYHSNALPSQPTKSILPVDTVPTTPLFSGLTPGYPGLYQINFIVPGVPGGLPACAAGQGPSVIATNLTVSVGGLSSFDGAGICVLLPEGP